MISKRPKSTVKPGTWLGIIISIVSALYPIMPAKAQLDTRSGDLLQLSEDIKAEMPGKSSEGFAKPTASDMEKWQNMVTALLQSELAKADSLRAAHFSFYNLFFFADTSLENRNYIVLQENSPVQRGWGTVMVNPNFGRQVCIEIPHPAFDTNTYRQGVDIFRRTGARFLLMAGTHRCANAEHSPCDGSSSTCGDGVFHVSDMAHFDSTMFQTTHAAIIAIQQGTTFINLHGNSRSSCEDIFLSNGHSTLTTQILQDLKTDMLASGLLTVAMVGDGSACSLVGSTNVQGRLTNGVQQPCSQFASAVTPFFIHVEQSRQVRDTFSLYSILIDAINNNVANNPVPVELTSFYATTAQGEVVLYWSTATETNNYGFDIERSEDSQNWDRIGFVAGHGTITAPMNYSFRDNNLEAAKYSYRLKQIDTDGQFEYSREIEVDVAMPSHHDLLQNFPNPFNPSTVIQYHLPSTSKVTLIVYDVSGSEVRRLVDEERLPGLHSVVWDGRNNSGQLVASGMYFYRLETADFPIIKKMLSIH